jgi:PKHD-type hydroxylase
MIIKLENILTPDELISARVILSKASYTEGKLTAGKVAENVKINLQAVDQKPVEELKNMIITKLLDNPYFVATARPKAISAIFSKYVGGHRYGIHVDNAQMHTGVRRDVSFTLFLSEFKDYEGGQLTIEGPTAFDAKLEAGDMIVYDSTTLHQVREVTSGIRFAMVGWVRSYIRDAHQRETLYDLDNARNILFHQHGKTPEFDLLTKTSHNLFRMWMDD